MAKTTEKKMMTKEKGHGVTGKKRSRRGKRVAAWFLAIAMMLTTISLPGNVKQASAMAISEKSVAIEMDGPILKKVTYDFRSLGASQNGIWYLYVWVKGDTSGVDGTPEIIAETALRSVDGDNTMEIDVDGQEGVVYSFGVCMKGSWCTESSPEGWPAITGIEDYELLSAKTTEDNVTVQVNGKEVSDSAEEVMENPEKYICYHEWEVTETLKPDCIHDGYNIQTCKKCKETSKVLSGIPALGHHYEDGVCSRCQMEDPTPVKPTGEGTEESPYQIKTTGELYWFAGLVNGDSTVCDYNEESKPDGIQQNPSAYAELKNNIVVNKGVLDEEGNPVTAHYTEWMPIGALGNPYSGMFDGNNYTISGLYFYDTDRKFAGFFGYAAPGTVIQNTVIADSYFCGKQTIGGICGWNRGTVTGCHNKATVEAWMSITIDSSNTNSLAGGICGGNADIGLIEDSVNDGKVLANNDYAGGIAGSNYNIITGCYNSGQIKGNDYVGGVAGMNQDNVVTNCYNSGLVKGDITVGGVVGYSTSATVANCYNIGTVEGISEVGGIAGDTSFSTVVHSYFLEGTKKEYYATSKSACQFANGEVAFLLSQGCTTEVTSSQDSSVSTVTFDGSVWGQNIDNEGERQYYPALNGDTAKVYETSAESGCQGYSNTKDKVREHYFGENCTDEICDYCCEIKNINYPGLSAECSEITYDGKSHTPEITIKAKKADNSDTASSDVDNVSDAGDSGADSSGGSGSSGDSGADNSGNSGADNLGDSSEDSASLTEGTDYEVSATAQTEVSADANGYTATITGKGAYAGTRTVQWNLTPKEITLTVEGKTTKPYDGTTDVFLDDILTNITTSLDGVLEEDKNDVSAKVSYAFADANANDSVVVNVTKAILEGNKSINYTLSEDITNTITGHITKLASTPALPQQQEREVAYTVDTVDKVTLPVGWEWAEEDKTKTLTVGETVTATAVYAGADKGNYETESVEIAITRQACTHEGTWDDGKVTKQPTEKETGVKTYTCTVCGETRTEEIPVVKPSGGNGTSDNNGTSDGNGTSNGNSNSGDVSRLPVKGSVVTDDQKTGKYQILNPAAKEVTFKGLANKNAKSVTILATVKIKGVTCKITGIADNAIKGSKKLTKAVIGSNVKTIGKNAFAGSKKLKTVKIGKNVTSIGANAFKKCTAVTSLTLPAKTVKIGANAFNGCKKLKKLTIKSKKMTKKTVAKNAFKGLTRKTKIKAPKAKVKTYKKLFRKRGLSGKVKVTK